MEAVYLIDGFISAIILIFGGVWWIDEYRGVKLAIRTLENYKETFPANMYRAYLHTHFVIGIAILLTPPAMFWVSHIVINDFLY